MLAKAASSSTLCALAADSASGCSDLIEAAVDKWADSIPAHYQLASNLTSNLGLFSISQLRCFGEGII